MEEKLDNFFNNLNSAAKVNLLFGFILKIIEDGGFRYFYALENNLLLDPTKLVWTRDDLSKLKDILNKLDVIELRSREILILKWRFYKLTNSTVFAVLLKNVRMGYRDAVFIEQLLRKGTIICHL